MFKKLLMTFVCLFTIAAFGANIEVEAASTGQLIVINKSTNKLAFFEDGEIVRTFSVGTGKSNDLTPEGRFPIVNKIKNRPYYTGGIPGGDPRNPLGNRWLGIDARGTYGTTYAIHGNNNPNSIGKYVSAGCVRMHNDEINWLFERVKLHTDVIIVSSTKSMEQIANDNGYKTEPPIDIYVDGKKLAVPNSPFMENNRVLVPMRSVFDALGATVVWNGKDQTITAAKGNKKMTLKINAKTVSVNGQAKLLDVPPRIYNGQTFVPTRFVSEELGAQVRWDGAKRVITITSAKQPVKPAEPAKTPVQVHAGGKALDRSFIMEGVTFVKARDLYDALEIGFSYTNTTKQLQAKKGTVDVRMTVGSKTMSINGNNQTMEKAPLMHDGSLYIPVRQAITPFNHTIQIDAGKVMIK